ncbi:MAG: hypothetical protein JXN61_08070 [Sedimentisphaerales bacterium]|nr:hypothetical protein [Sedimentisphaerales bacterium]
MAIEAPLSKYRKNGLIIYIFVCLVASAWFGYDGYFNEKFKAKHTGEDGKADSTLAFNRKAPPIGAGIAVLLAGYLLVIRGKKLIADDTHFVVSDKERIPYDSIRQIDKTHFDSKGYFVVTYKNESGNEIKCKISNRNYDNLAAVLDHLVGKIS